MTPTIPNGPIPGSHELVALWELSLELLSIASTDGRFLQLNGSWQRTLGWDTEQLRAAPIVTFVHPDDVAPTTDALERLRTPDATVLGFENRYLHLDGSYRWLRWNSRSDGERIYSVTTDVTEQRQAERALRESEQRWRLVQREAAMGLALVKPAGQWLAVNPALCDLLGYREEELLDGMTFQDVTHPDDLDADLELLGKLLDGTLPSYRMEKRYIRKSGELVWILLAVSLIRDAAGRPDYLIAQIVDITARKRQQRELERVVGALQASNEDLERFAAMAAHDLRSPITTVGGLVRLVRESEGISDDNRTLLDRAVANLDRVLGLSERLLRFARAGSGALEVELHDPGGLVAEAWESLSEEVQRRSAQITVGALPPVAVDAPTVRSVLQNLLSNAVRYVADDAVPDVAVTGRRDGDMVEIVIADNGPGISADQVEQVFVPFVRGTARAPGTGLGLATARRLAERNGGSLHAEPGAERGVRMVLRLPAALGPVPSR